MFKTRSQTKELLDGDDIPEPDLFRNLEELHTINRLLGGYTITFNALKKVCSTHSVRKIVDIGCGGGDTLKELHRWGIKNQQAFELIGVDYKPVCIAYSQQNNTGNPAITFVCDDYRNVPLHATDIDVLHASLFCHHLSESEIVELINFAVSNKILLIINDLERNPVAYYAIKILTRLFSRSYLVKNDAPLSVLRGFKRREWKQLLGQSAANNYSVLSKWAFRHEVIVYHD